MTWDVKQQNKIHPIFTASNQTEEFISIQSVLTVFFQEPTKDVEMEETKEETKQNAESKEEKKEEKKDETKAEPMAAEAAT